MATKSDRYLVTGGSGFCGFEIARYLLEKGHPVRVLDIAELPQPLAGAEFYRGDIRAPKTVQEACRGIDLVIHAAAKVPVTRAGKDFWAVNLEGTRRVMEAAKALAVKKVVHISSSSVQVSDQNPIEEDAPFHCIGDYSSSKLAAEKVCLEYRNAGLPIDIIRPRTVLGPGRLGIFELIFERIAEGKTLYLPGGGMNRIQLLHSRDLADCVYRCSQNSESGTYNIGSASFLSLIEDLRLLINHAKSKSRLQPIPVKPIIQFLSFLDWLNLSPLSAWHYMTFHRDFYFTNERALRELGWHPEFGNREILFSAYDSYLTNRASFYSKEQSKSHRHPIRRGLLTLMRFVP